MDNLFIDTPEIDKIAMTTLGDDVSVWVKKIVMTFTEEYPELQNAPMNVVWKQKDLKTGAAVGNLHVGDAISVPLIVENFMLYPLDIVMFEGRAYPLTRETLDEYFKSPQAFQQLSQLTQEGNERLFDSPLRLPTDTGSSMAVSEPVNALDKISSFVHEKDYKIMLDEISKPENYAGFIQNETTDIVEKLSSIEPTNEVNFAEALLNNIDMDRQLINEDSYGNCTIKQANSKIDYTYDIPVDSSEDFEELFNATPDTTKIASAPLDINSYHVEDDVLCITKAGDYREFDKNREIPIKVDNFELEGSDPKLGDYGTFVIGENATKPFEVVELQKMAGVGNFEVVGWNGFDRTTYLPIKGITDSNVIPHETIKSAKYVPGNGVFVKLADRLTVDYSEIDTETSPCYIGRDSSGLYYLEGEGFAKYGEHHSTRDLTEFDAKWVATHCGAYQEDVTKLASLNIGEKYEVEAPIRAPFRTEDIQTKIQSEYDKMSRDISVVASSLVKEAAGIADKNSVDVLLSLGLVNRDNVMEFTTLIPEYEAAAAGLAKLLLTARLGLKILDAEALMRGMKALVKAVYQLKYLKQLVK